VRNGRNGGQEGPEGTNTDQHNEESKAFGQQRQMNSIRWPPPDCGLERMKTVVGWIGSVTGIMQPSSRTGPQLLSSLHNGETIGGLKDKEHRYLRKIRMTLRQRDECTDLVEFGGRKERRSGGRVKDIMMYVWFQGIIK
jgi:hypothetical protein